MIKVLVISILIAGVEVNELLRYWNFNICRINIKNFFKL